MEVTFLLHGILIRQAGAEHITFNCPPEASVQQALELLAAHCPAVIETLERCVCAIGDSLVSRDTRLAANTELALIPPVSGG